MLDVYLPSVYARFFRELSYLFAIGRAGSLDERGIVCSKSGQCCRRAVLLMSSHYHHSKAGNRTAPPIYFATHSFPSTNTMLRVAVYCFCSAPRKQALNPISVKFLHSRGECCLADLALCIYFRPSVQQNVHDFRCAVFVPRRSRCLSTLRIYKFTSAPVISSAFIITGSSLRIAIPIGACRYRY